LHNIEISQSFIQPSSSYYKISKIGMYIGL
jgi:hypothetical protein